MTGVPNILWTTWFQGWDTAPDLVQACRRTWRERNPGWTQRELTNSSLGEHIDVQARFPSIRGKLLTPQAYSDLLRIALLEQHGGVWVDATVWCAKPLDDWLPPVAPRGFFAFERPGPDRMVASWFLAATPGHPTVRRWADLCEDFWSDRDSTDDYFWFHHLFEDAYRLDPAVRQGWDATPKMSAGPPHRFQSEMARLVDDRDRELLAGAEQPVFKLDHRFLPGDVEGTVYGEICHNRVDEVSTRSGPADRVLLLWFGSIAGHGTIGDLLSVAAASTALTAAGIDADCATWCPVPGARLVSADEVDPRAYRQAIFVCGPIMRLHAPLHALVGRFDALPLTGVGVSLFPEGHWNHWDPFDSVLAREGGDAWFDDIAMAAPMPAVAARERAGGPLRVGLALRGAQAEYSADLCLSERADELVDAMLGTLAGRGEVDVVPIEHHLGRSGRTPDEIEAQYASCDVVLTTRLHGAVMAARHQVPFVALDQIAGGAKVAGVLGRYSWPHVYRVDSVDADTLNAAVSALRGGPDDGALARVRQEMLDGAHRTLEALVERMLSGSLQPER